MPKSCTHEIKGTLHGDLINSVLGNFSKVENMASHIEDGKETTSNDYTKHKIFTTNC